MRVILLYWFAAQHQTNTLSRQRSRSILSKFVVVLSEVTPRFEIHDYVLLMWQDV